MFFHMNFFFISGPIVLQSKRQPIRNKATIFSLYCSIVKVYEYSIAYLDNLNRVRV